MNRVSLAAAVLLLAFAGCRKPKPSPFFTEAQGKYSSLVAELGDPAFSDDRMTEVEELLKKVPGDSLDAAAASDLQRKINSERKRIAEEAAEHERAMANALAPPDYPDSPRTPDRPNLEPAAPDAGGDKAAELAIGITVDQMRKQSGDCFNPAGELKLRRSAVDEVAEMWERREAAGCPARWPQYGGKILVFVAGKFTGAYDRSALRDEAPTPEQLKQKAPEKPAQAPPPPPANQPPQPPPGGENTGPGPTEP